MSIFFIVGKPGGGKSYLGVVQMLEELKDPTRTRNIVTNITLNLDELAVWCHKNCAHEVNIKERVRILTEAETAEFWRYEPHMEWNKRKKFTTGQGNRVREYDVPDFDGRGSPGTLYVIDEVHIHFGAREWQQTGTDCTWFLTQHRKLGCDVIFITQHPDQTDKALRRLAQEYMTVRNLSREPVMGFRVGNMFRYIRSLHSPTSTNWAPFESGYLRLKPEEIGKLYDTTAGVGIAGRVTPRVESRGRSLWWLAIPILAFVLLIYNMKPIVHWLRMKATTAVNTGLTGVMTNASLMFVAPKTTNVTRTTTTPEQPKPLPGVLRTSYDVVTSTNTEPTRPVYLEKFYLHGSKTVNWFCLLSDGTTHNRLNSTLSTVNDYGIVMNSKWYPYKRWAHTLDNEGYLWHNVPVASEVPDSGNSESKTETPTVKEKQATIERQ